MMQHKVYQPVVYSILIIVGLILGSIINNSPSLDKIKNKKINTVLNLINEHYVDSIPADKFNDNTINSILENLDPHSTYIPSKNIKSLSEDMQGSFSGIGVQFNIIKDTIVVISAISGGPSEKLGILSGDRIIRVDDEDVASIKIKNEGVIKRLRGKKGTAVNVRIIRKGERNSLDFVIIRDDIPLYSVDCSIMLKEYIGYIKINRFSATTYKEFFDGFSELLEKDMRKLILDFRGNPGGYLAMAIRICDELLIENNLIVYTEGRNRPREDVYSTKNGLLLNTEIIILIDEGSASASEIVAGAIQDNDRGIILGRRSFGKGLVQEQIQLTDSSAIRLTTQRYYTPSGRCIQKTYGKNNTEYYLEPYLRKEEELSDTLKYTTKEGRVVYGGGGINPDIIIAKDTTLDYTQINLMLNKGWINEFCLQESIKIKNIQSKEQFLYNDNQNNIYNLFLKFISNKDQKIKIAFGNTETKYLKSILKATIARSAFNSQAYYEILSSEDRFIQKAIVELEKDRSSIQKHPYE